MNHFLNSGQNMTAAWESMRKFSPKGPLINSEFYPGWLTHWGENAISVSSTKVVEYMEKMFAVNASFNFYMFYGGTNFGFTAGTLSVPVYLSVVCIICNIYICHICICIRVIYMLRVRGMERAMTAVQKFGSACPFYSTNKNEHGHCVVERSAPNQII